MNSFSSVRNSTIYPKFYWSCPKLQKSICAVGVDEVSTTAPIVDREGEIWLAHLRFNQQKTPSFPWNDWVSYSFYKPTFAIFRDKQKIKTYGKGNLLKEKNSIKTRDFSTVTLKKRMPEEHLWKNLIALSQKEIDKVVLARLSHYQINISPWDLVQKLELQNPNAFVFCIEREKGKAFVGASPERLFSREKMKIFSSAIAGTHEIVETAKAPHLMDSFGKDPKELQEFSYVDDFIKNRLEKLCKSFTKSPIHIINTSTVYHLCRHFSGNLMDGIKEDKIVKALFPTPATLGFPREKALRFLLKHEPFDRGLYAGTIGFITKDYSEFSVSIRSALLDQQNLYTFAGAGIVADSKSEKEWEEINNKEKTILQAFHG